MIVTAPVHKLWFRSTLFEIEPGEDLETNPYCFGRQFARWLRERLVAQGRAVEELIPEDWGWCLMTQRKPFMLWVGCVSVRGLPYPPSTDPLPHGSEVTWACTVVAERSILGRLFRNFDTVAPVEELFRQVRSIIETEPCNSLVEQP